MQIRALKEKQALRGQPFVEMKDDCAGTLDSVGLSFNFSGPHIQNPRGGISLSQLVYSARILGSGPRCLLTSAEVGPEDQGFRNRQEGSFLGLRAASKKGALFLNVRAAGRNRETQISCDPVPAVDWI